MAGIAEDDADGAAAGTGPRAGTGGDALHPRRGGPDGDRGPGDGGSPMPAGAGARIGRPDHPTDDRAGADWPDGSGPSAEDRRASDCETFVCCFTPGTRIATEAGAVPICGLGVGARVLTRDSGMRPLRWIGRRSLDAAALARHPELQPIRIRAGALGPGMPDRDMMVSPQHRLLAAGPRADLLFGAPEVLVPAVHLVGRAGIDRAGVDAITYLHLLFDRHEIILSDGAWTESFQPGDRTLAGLDAAQRRELGLIFPQLLDGARFASARRSLRAHEARALFGA